MTRRAVVALALLLAWCSWPSRTLFAQSPPTRTDTAAILRTVWDTAAGAIASSAGRVSWFWAPSTADSARVIPLSPEVRELLVRLRIPAYAYRPTGDDTVVFRLTEWQPASTSVNVVLASEWSVVLGTGPRRCRTGSGNVERFQVRREGGGWVAVRLGAVIHGDRACTPLR